MRVKEKKLVTECREVTLSVKCDVCGKMHQGSDLPDEWHSFSHHHNHWGNDSYESYEYHDVCSPECYWKRFSYCIAELDGCDDAEVDGFQIQFGRVLDKQNE